MAGKQLSVLIHFTWSTKNREPIIATDWRDRLHGYIGGVLRRKNATPICAGGTADHVHICAAIPATSTLAELANSMKANSSRWVHQEFKKHKSFAWQQGYGDSA